MRKTELGLKSPLVAMCLSQERQVLAFASADAVIRLVDVRAPKAMCEWKPPQTIVPGMTKSRTTWSCMIDGVYRDDPEH